MPSEGRPCYIGIDLGTSGCRAIAIDDDANVLASARCALPASRRAEPGTSEQLPSAWWEGFRKVITELRCQTSARPRALAFDGTSSSLLLCDAGGRPLTPALMYDDTRAGPQALRVARHAPPESPARGPGSALAKLLYLLEHQAPSNACHAVHQADWMLGRLAGRQGLSDEHNALKLGYDPVARGWPGWIGATGVPIGLLPEVRPVGTPVGRIDPTVARLLELPPDLCLVAGTTDSNAAALATGIASPGDAVSSLGSTLVLKIICEAPVNDAASGVYSHRIGDLWLAGGASNTGGGVLRQHFSDAELQRLSAAIDPACPPGLDYYPLPGKGERFPHHDPEMLPRITPVPADRTTFLHALFEGMAAIEASGYRRLVELGAPQPRRVLSSGGGAANPAWRQIRARRLKVPVYPAQHTEAAYGTARIARDAVLPQHTAQ